MKYPTQSKAILAAISRLERKAATPTVFDAFVKSFSDEAIKSGDLLKDLLKSGKLVRYDFPFLNRKKTIFALRETPLVSLILEISENAYISHGTAATIHGLTAKIKDIYVNIEQTKASPQGNILGQSALNRAFASKPRFTTNIVTEGKVSIIQLNGKNTKKLGVKQHELKAGKNTYTLRVTSLERTLVDIATRPINAGGPAVVLECFQNASRKVDVKKLVQTLKEINHIYPYHQAIGYYMEKSGAYSQSEIALLKKIPRELEFFLDYAMQEKTFCAQWKIWVPIKL